MERNQIMDLVGIINDDVVMHNGAWLAANTYFVRNTKKKTSFVLLDNSSNLFFDKIIGSINKTIANNGSCGTTSKKTKKRQRISGFK